MPTNDEILAAIPSTEAASFNEFLNALPDVPERGDREEWSKLFSQLIALHTQGLIEIERTGPRGAVESLMLTAEGAAAVRRRTRQ